MEIKDIAAFGGLLLGITNLGFTIWEKYIKKPKLGIHLEKSLARCYYEGSFGFQIDGNIQANNGDIYLKNIFIKNEEALFADGKKELEFYKMINYSLHDLLIHDANILKNKIDEVFSNKIYIRDKKIGNNESFSFTFFGTFESFRLMDGWEDIPLKKWKLIIEHNHGKISVPFDFIEHNKSQKGNLTNRYNSII